jgi:hypothetical protein
MYLNCFASHYKPTISGTTETYQHIADFKINIQPATPESTAMVNGVYGRTFIAFMTYSGLNIEDQVTISGVETPYKVKGILPYDYAPMAHYEVILTAPEI